MGVRSSVAACAKSRLRLVLPTAPTIYRIADTIAEPFELNARLGTYTNFVNLDPSL